MSADPCPHCAELRRELAARTAAEHNLARRAQHLRNELDTVAELEGDLARLEPSATPTLDDRRADGSLIDPALFRVGVGLPPFLREAHG